YLWQNGSFTDLNTLIPPSMNLDVLFGSNINDLGEITGATVNAQGLERGFVLVPRGFGHALPQGVSARKVTLPESVRMRVQDRRGPFWDLRGKTAFPR
ncbi:MAG: hypothetical protein WBW76_06685, partial [Candidatus Cybelea sp.]